MELSCTYKQDKIVRVPYFNVPKISQSVGLFSSAAISRTQYDPYDPYYLYDSKGRAIFSHQFLENFSDFIKLYRIFHHRSSNLRGEFLESVSLRVPVVRHESEYLLAVLGGMSDVICSES